jgi:hypothetical protein
MPSARHKPLGGFGATAAETGEGTRKIIVLAALAAYFGVPASANAMIASPFHISITPQWSDISTNATISPENSRR